MSIEEGINENDVDLKSQHPKKARKKMTDEEKKLRDKLRKQEKRKNTAFKEAERNANRIRQHQARANEEYTFKEQSRNTSCKRAARNDEYLRSQEQERDTSRRRDARTQDDYRSLEQERDTSKRRDARTQDDYRSQEQERDTTRRRDARTQEDYRTKEQSQDTSRRREERENPHIRERDRASDLASKQRTRSHRTYLVQKYENSVLEGPTIICVCCGGLFFKRSIKLIGPSEIDKIPQDMREKVFHCKEQKQSGRIIRIEENQVQCYYLCLNCKKYIFNSPKPTMPPLALSEGLDFTDIPECLTRLNDLEERRITKNTIHEHPAA